MLFSIFSSILFYSVLFYSFLFYSVLCPGCGCRGQRGEMDVSSRFLTEELWDVARFPSRPPFNGGRGATWQPVWASRGPLTASLPPFSRRCSTIIKHLGSARPRSPGPEAPAQSLAQLPTVLKGQHPPPSPPPPQPIWPAAEQTEGSERSGNSELLGSTAHICSQAAAKQAGGVVWGGPALVLTLRGGLGWSDVCGSLLMSRTAMRIFHVSFFFMFL